jgi:nucleoside-diphosphate-sugar epimerase
MLVLVLGGTGLIGSAVMEELKARGHGVLALTRSNASAEKAARLGAAVMRGDIATPETWVPALPPVDAVIHAARYDGNGGGVFRRFGQEAIERPAIRVVGSESVRWPLVRHDDLAALYALALESAPSRSIKARSSRARVLASVSSPAAHEKPASFGEFSGGSTKRQHGEAKQRPHVSRARSGGCCAGAPPIFQAAGW